MLYRTFATPSTPWLLLHGSLRERQGLAHSRCSCVVQASVTVMPEHYILGASASPIGWEGPREEDPGEAGEAGSQENSGMRS